jgi:hypothetical protein
MPSKWRNGQELYVGAVKMQCSTPLRPEIRPPEIRPPRPFPAAKNNSEPFPAANRQLEFRYTARMPWPKGKPRPPETCAKISKAQKGKTLTPEHRAN